MSTNKYVEAVNQKPGIMVKSFGRRCRCKKMILPVSYVVEVEGFSFICHLIENPTGKKKPSTPLTVLTVLTVKLTGDMLKTVPKIDVLFMNGTPTGKMTKEKNDWIYIFNETEMECYECCDVCDHHFEIPSYWFLVHLKREFS